MIRIGRNMSRPPLFLMRFRIRIQEKNFSSLPVPVVLLGSSLPLLFATPAFLEEKVRINECGTMLYRTYLLNLQLSWLQVYWYRYHYVPWITFVSKPSQYIISIKSIMWSGSGSRLDPNPWMPT